MQTICEIGGTPYKLFYEKQSSAQGIYYHGQVLNPAQLRFNFIEGRDDEKIAFGSFQPPTEPLYIQMAVINAIRQSEANEQSGVFRNAGE